MVIRFIIITFLLTISLAKEAVMLTVDNQQITEGESINLTLTIDDIKGEPEIDFSKMIDFKIVTGPLQSSSTNVQFVNGNMTRSSTTKYSWSIMPNRIGKLKIPSLQIDIGKGKYSTTPIIISVLKRGSGPKQKNPQFFLESSIDKETIYRGEQLTLTYKLFTKIDVTSFEEEMPSFSGFWIEDLFTPKKLQLRKEVKNGVQYYSAIIKKIALFPTKSGPIKIQPLYAVIGVRENQQRWNDFSLFGPPSKKHTISTSEILVNVLPLPPNPSGEISTLVGDWQISSKINGKNFKQDEAFILELEVQGIGNLQTVPIPNINFPKDIEVFDPEIKMVKNPLRDKIGGKKNIEWVLIPRSSGEIIIPNISLNFFNSKTKKWIEKTTNIKKINILPNDNIIYNSKGFSKQEVELVGEDIHFIDNSSAKWISKNRSYFNSISLSLMLFSGLIFAFPYIYGYKMQSFQKKTNNRKAKKALKSSLIILNSNYTTENDIYALIYNAVICFINHKTNSNKVEYSTSEILEVLGISINEELCMKINNILLRGESVRFAGILSSNAESDLNSIKELLKKINHAWK